MKTLRKYSEGFKLQVLRELEEGKFESQEALRRTYGTHIKNIVSCRTSFGFVPLISHG